MRSGQVLSSGLFCSNLNSSFSSLHSLDFSSLHTPLLSSPRFFCCPSFSSLPSLPCLNHVSLTAVRLSCVLNYDRGSIIQFTRIERTSPLKAGENPRQYKVFKTIFKTIYSWFELIYRYEYSSILYVMWNLMEGNNAYLVICECHG